MASLTDKRIKNTYDGLLKTTDNDALGGIYKLITDGLGNSSGVYLGTGGNVGINVSSPSYKLQVNGSVGIQGIVEIDGNLEVAQGLGGDRCLFINTSTGAFEIGDASGLGDFAFISGDSSSLSMQVNQVVGLHVDSNSNVGIKTTSPTQALDVNGNITANRYYGRTNTTYYIDPNDTTQSIYVAGDIRITDSSTATIKLDSTSIYPTQKIIATRSGSESPNMGELSWNDNPGIRGSQWISRRYSSPYTTSSVTLPTDANRDFEVNILGTERFRIDSSTGNVGIGTTNPDDGNLQIGDSNTSYNIAMAGTRTKFGYDGTSAIVQGGAAKGIKFCVNNNTFASGEVMRINTAGNVGIGETSPAERLHISGSVDNDDVALRIDNDSDDNSSSTPPSAAVVFNTASNNGHVRVFGAPADTAANHKMDIGSTAASSYLTFSPSGTERMRIDSSGRVGIGISSITANAIGDDLQIGDGSGGSRGLTITAQNNSGATIFFGDADDTDIGSIRYDNSNNSMKFFTNTSERMRIDSSGNVGIGTTSPDVALEVVGNGIRVSDGTDQGIVYFRTDRNDVYIKENGNFQVETGAPSGIVFECDTNSNGFGTFNVKRQNASRFYITDGGNVGIGTTSPAEKLTVSASDDVVIRINSTKNGTWTSGQSLGALEFFGNDASGGQGAGIKGKIDVVSLNQYGAAFDMKFFTSNGSTDPTTENFKIAYDGGIFAPALLGSSASNPDVRYNTTTDELYYNSSSIRYKEDITDLENSLDKIDNLRPVKFKNKESGEYATGLIAEEVVDVLPELVFKKQIEGFDEPQIDGVSYGDLHAYYIKAIQQLKSEIEILKSQIN